MSRGNGRRHLLWLKTYRFASSILAEIDNLCGKFDLVTIDFLYEARVRNGPVRRIRNVPLHCNVIKWV